MSCREACISRGVRAGLAARVMCLLLIAPASDAQPTDDPIATSAAVATWAIELGDVVAIPDSSLSPPRLEQLVWNETTGLAYVIDQRGPIYSFDPNAATPTRMSKVRQRMSKACQQFWHAFFMSGRIHFVSRPMSKLRMSKRRSACFDMVCHALASSCHAGSSITNPL